MENNKSVTAVKWLIKNLIDEGELMISIRMTELVSKAEKMESEKNKKYNEMLGMLQKCEEYFLLKTDAKSEERADAIAQLIEEATKL